MSVCNTSPSCFDAGNQEFRQARNRCSRAVIAFNNLPPHAEAKQRVHAWIELVDPARIYTAANTEAHTAKVAFQNPSITPSAPLVKSPIRMDYGLRVRIAPTAFVNYNCSILDTPVADVVIGDHVNIGPNVTIISVSHPLKELDENNKRFSVGLPVVIEDGAWIATGVTILPGVTVGKGSVVAAGSLVTKDIAPNSLAMGSPAKAIRKLNTKIAKKTTKIMTVSEALQCNSTLGSHTAAGIAQVIKDNVEEKQKNVVEI